MIAGARQLAGCLGGILFAATACPAGDLEGLFPGGLDHPAIEYANRPTDDVVARLNRKIQDGTVRLRYDPKTGYLGSILEALDVSVESQLVVFSKTSFQSPLINPQNPRTIFFGDSVAIAGVRNGLIEIAAHDPRQGVIFYVIDQASGEHPRLKRSNACLQCHEAHASLGVPGMIMRSVYPGPTGLPVRSLGEFLTDHRSPIGERWGGWYVTGTTAGQHLGNAVYQADGPPGGHPAAVSLEGYLSPYSDVAALSVFGHQVRAVNLLTRVGWEVRLALTERRDAAGLLRETARELVDYLLFVDEAPLGGKLAGNSGFAAKFAARGPRDSHGRSLRDLDLERRLFRYPCSYMIYTEAFDALPAEARAAIYRRMWEVLSGAEKGPRYARLSAADRRAVIEILRETKKGLPDYFGGPR